MKKRTVVLFLLTSLLSACVPAATPIPPTAAVSPSASAIPPQTSPPSFTPQPRAALTQTDRPVPEASLTPPPGRGFAIERAAQLGGSINGITVVGNLAYVGMGPRLAAVDISQHNKPQLVSQSETLPGMVTQVLQIHGDPDPHLLVNAGKYLVVMDISNPGELTPVHQLELAGAISAMVWDAQVSIAYVGGSIYQSSEKYTGFISAVGISKDNNPRLINSVEMPEQPLSLALAEGSLFAGAQGYEGGLYHIQLKSPAELATPQLVIASTPINPFQPFSMQVIGERLFVAYMTLDAYDITNPGQPLQTWTENMGMVVKGFSVTGDQINVFGWAPAGTYTPELKTIPLPEPPVGSPVGKTASVTATHNGDFLVAYHDLEIYDTARPNGPQLVGSYQAPVTKAIGAAVNENAVFVVDNAVGDGRSSAVLRVLSLPDLTPLGQMMTELPTSWHYFHGIALDSDRVYIASEDGVWVYGVSRAEPTLLGKLEISGGELETFTAIRLAEKRLLVTSQVRAGVNVLTTYDLTDLQKPAEIGSPLTLDQGRAFQMAWDGSVIYALLDPLNESGGILYSITFDNDALAVRESLQLPDTLVYNVVENGFIALLGTQRLLILSTIEPEPLKLLAQIALPERGTGVAILEDKALVVVGDDPGAAQLLIFDLHDPAHPRQVDAVDIAVSENPAVPILVATPYAVLANGSGGVEVLEHIP